jgi:hypothetical protein
MGDKLLFPENWSVSRANKDENPKNAHVQGIFTLFNVAQTVNLHNCSRFPLAPGQ